MKNGRPSNPIDWSQVEQLYVQGEFVVPKDAPPDQPDALPVRCFPSIAELAGRFDSSVGTVGLHARDECWSTKRAAFQAALRAESDKKLIETLASAPAMTAAKGFTLARNLMDDAERIRARRRRQSVAEFDAGESLNADDIERIKGISVAARNFTQAARFAIGNGPPVRSDSTPGETAGEPVPEEFSATDKEAAAAAVEALAARNRSPSTHGADTVPDSDAG